MPSRSANGPRVWLRLPRGRGLHREKLRKTVLRTLERAAPQVVGDVCIVIVDDAEMRALNNQYRAKDTPTDVLAFPIADGTRPGEPFGDVVVSLQTARRQAREYGAALQSEVNRLLVHGMLHLCGYDHQERAQASRMHRLTRRILRELSSRG